jgi:hypothetical protein
MSEQDGPGRVRFEEPWEGDDLAGDEEIVDEPEVDALLEDFEQTTVDRAPEEDAGAGDGAHP